MIPFPLFISCVQSVFPIYFNLLYCVKKKKKKLENDSMCYARNRMEYIK